MSSSEAAGVTGAVVAGGGVTGGAPGAPDPPGVPGGAASDGGGTAGDEGAAGALGPLAGAGTAGEEGGEGWPRPVREDVSEAAAAGDCESGSGDAASATNTTAAARGTGAAAKADETDGMPDGDPCGRTAGMRHRGASTRPESSSRLRLPGVICTCWSAGSGSAGLRRSAATRSLSVARQRCASQAPTPGPPAPGRIRVDPRPTPPSLPMDLAPAPGASEALRATVRARRPAGGDYATARGSRPGWCPAG